jgi:hypothetical protein
MRVVTTPLMVTPSLASELEPPPLPGILTKPPTFSHAVELMDADDWLKSFEKKLQVVQCNNG